MIRAGSRSDIDRSTATNDSRPSARPSFRRLVTIVNVEQAPSPHYPRSFLLQSRIHRYDKPGRGGPVSRRAGSPLGRLTSRVKYASLPHGSARLSRVAAARFRDKPSRIMRARVLIVLLLAVTIHAMAALSGLRAEDTSRIPMQLTQHSQAPRQGPFLEGAQMVRPSPKEREAIYQLLALKPRPKTLKDADVKYLQRMRDKASWFVFERRMMHEIWADVSGTEWRDPEGPQPHKNETTP
jgi:hypothetical protein